MSKVRGLRAYSGQEERLISYRDAITRQKGHLCGALQFPVPTDRRIKDIPTALIDLDVVGHAGIKVTTPRHK